MPADEPPAGDLLKEALDRLIEVLNDNDLQYALIGGLAVGLRGAVRATEDIDIVLVVPQLRLPTVLEQLQQRGFDLELKPAIATWNRDSLLRFSFGRTGIDWIKPHVPAHDRVLERAKWEGRGEPRVRVADAEGLILLKLMAFRPQDEQDIATILAANADRLDLDWIRREWSQIGGADDERTRAFERMVRESQ